MRVTRTRIYFAFGTHELPHKAADRGKEERYALQINRRTILFVALAIAVDSVEPQLGTQ